jgi:hypothetical protein
VARVGEGAVDHKKNRDATGQEKQMVVWKRILKGALGALVALVVLLWGIKAYRDAHYFDNYDPRAPLNVAVLETTEVAKESPETGYTITRFVFDAYKGEQVPTLISMPIQRGGKKLPAIIFLHGIGQKRGFSRKSPIRTIGQGLRWRVSISTCRAKGSCAGRRRS